jgi:hypothetical protein
MPHALPRDPEPWLRAAAWAGLLLLGACAGNDGGSGSGEYYTWWDRAGGCAGEATTDQRRNAEGKPVDVCQPSRRGRWTWVSYGAGWCSVSRRQAPVVSALARSGRRDLEVFTVLTSGDEVFVPAQSGDAKAWAAAYGLAPARVLMGPDEGSRTVPQHLLIGPDGETWYRYIGRLELAEMTQLLDDFASGLRTPDVRDLPEP